MPTYQPPISVTRPKVSAETPRPMRRLFSSRRLGDPHPEGVTVWKKNGVWFDSLVPTSDQLEDADHVFLGGHVYEVTDAVLVELTEAGMVQ